MSDHPAPQTTAPSGGAADQPETALPDPSLPTGLHAGEDNRRPSDLDLQVLSRMLGRQVRDVVEIPARCVCGNPLVAATAPRLSGGSPFPTVFYLAHPVITAAVSRLEADGAMYGMTDRLGADPQLAASYQRSHLDYLNRRERIGAIAGSGEVPEIDGISAGGMPTRVKCLHVLVGHALAAGPGVNLLGDETLGLIEQTWDRGTCACDPAWREPAA